MPHLFLYEMPAFIEEHKELIIILIIGAFAGYIAEFIVPGRGYGLLVTTAIGMAGGWLGNMLFKSFIHFNTDIPYLNEIIRATIGAMIIVIGLNLLLDNKKNKRKEKNVYDWENE